MNSENYQPEFGIPKECTSQDPIVGKTYRIFADLISPQIESVDVIYYNLDAFSNIGNAENYVTEFLNQRYEHSRVTGWVNWAEGHGYPEVWRLDRLCTSHCRR